MAIFRKSVLDRLSSPDELDTMLQVTSPRAWLALVALFALLAAGVLWSVLATIPTNVAGRGVLAAREPGNSLEAVVYVSLDDGPRIRPGMPVKVGLSSVRKEEFGLALGTVVAVADQPANQQELQQVVGNDAYAQSLAAESALIQVRIALLADPETPSGFRWTTRRGPAAQLRSGMLCGATITIGVDRPIDLVLPH